MAEPHNTETLGQTPTAPTDSLAARREAHQKLGMWLFLRLFVPIGPIIIQYSLYGLDAYQPETLQITYITIMFSLSLATLTEYTDKLGIVYLGVIPAMAATFLYTVALLVKSNQHSYEKVLATGFVLWSLLITINIARVIIDWRRRLRELRNPA